MSLPEYADTISTAPVFAAEAKCAPIFVEILTPDGDVKHRYRFSDLPIRIGRAYDNDIILDDPHTAAHHAQIEYNQLDELIISDCGSLSGITQANHREDFFVVNGDHDYRLGRTLLRIRHKDYPVAPELTDTTNHYWEGWRPALTGIFILTCIGVLTTRLSDINESTLSKYLLELVSVIGFVACWSGVWALFSKLFSGQARFGRHVWIASCGLVSLELWDLLSGMTAFAFSWETLATFSNHPPIFIGALVLYFHLQTTGNKHLGRLKIILAVLAVMGSTITMTKQYQATNHLASQLYMSELYPPVLRISRDKTLDEFMSDINSLKPIVDDARKKDSDKERATPENIEHLMPNEDDKEKEAPKQTEEKDIQPESNDKKTE